MPQEVLIRTQTRADPTKNKQDTTTATSGRHILIRAYMSTGKGLWRHHIARRDHMCICILCGWFPPRLHHRIT